ncbi:hypothetical protein [Vreelandella venusta]|uniref:hypothetical protein n=1 Tax=Vreelandella venusta TaxID=44935 RepID=UPI0018DA623A|nr:hypothetical protein [Halomonas venusta]QPI65857.1 hypothetical protein IR195_09240 [Halomonas venusta]
MSNQSQFSTAELRRRLDSLKQGLGHIGPPLEEMEQWEVEKALGGLIEGIQEKYHKAAGLEWSAKALREEADQMAETLALYRQRLGLPLTQVPKKGAKRGEPQYQTTQEDKASSSVSPHARREG